MSKREVLRQRRHQQSRLTQLALMGGVALLAVAVTGYLIYENTRPIGEFKVIAKHVYPYAQGKALGAPDAPVVIQEFADFQCPACGVFATRVEDQLIEQYIAPGKVRFEYYHFLIVDQITGKTESHRAAEASECANEQNEFWNFHAMLFANQHGEGLGAFSDRRLKAFAESLGLDSARFNACFDAGRYTATVDADERLGVARGLQGTPTMFINGALFDQPLNWAALSQQIEALLAGQ